MRTTLPPILINFFLLILMGTTWGLHFVLIKQVSNQGVPNHLILFPTLMGVSLVFLILLLFNKIKSRLSREVWIFLIFCSLLGYALPIWLEITVASYIDSTLLTLITTSTPIFCILFAYLFRLTTISAWHLLCVSLGILATLLLLLPDSAIPESSSPMWLTAAIGVPCSYAFYNLYVAKAWPKGLNMYTMAAIESVLAALFVLPLFLRSGAQYGYSTMLNHTPLLITLVVVTAIEVWAFFELVRRTGAIYVSFATFVALLSGVIWSFLLLDETITRYMTLSMSFIVLALFCCLFAET